MMEHRDSLLKNGFVKIDNFFHPEELEDFKKGATLVRSKPTAFKILMEDGDNEFFMDYNNWRRYDNIFTLCANPKILSLIKKLTKSDNCWLMHDDVIIKKGNLSPETPIHHDRPYFIFKGDLNLSVWIALTKIPKNSSLIMYKKSHLHKDIFLPKNFKTKNNAQKYNNLDRNLFKEINDNIVQQFDKVDFEMLPGDLIVFFHKTLHSAKQHSSPEYRKSFVIRYLLDGAKMTQKYYTNVPPYDRQGVQLIEYGAVPEKYFPRLGF